MNKRNYVIYVAGKYTAPTKEEVQENVLEARQYAIEVWKLGYTAHCPHLNTAFFDEGTELDYEDFMTGDFELIKRSDGVIMMPNWTDSMGATREREHAIKLGKPVFHSLEELAEWNPNAIH